MIQAPEGGFILAGETASSSTGGADAYLLQTDAMGNGLWRRTFGG